MKNEMNEIETVRGNVVIENTCVFGNYMGVNFSGRVESFHTDTAGGKFKTATVSLSSPVVVFGAIRERVLMMLDLDNKVCDSKFGPALSGI